MSSRRSDQTCHEGARISFILGQLRHVEETEGGAYNVFDEFDARDILGETFGEVGENSDVQQV
jgi:hypothetical protein